MNKYTSEELRKFPAGEKLDVLVSYIIMGKADNHLKPQWYEGSTSDGEDSWDGFFCPRCGCPDDLYDKKPCCPKYSTDISAAWRAAERLFKNGWYFELIVNSRMTEMNFEIAVRDSTRGTWTQYTGSDDAWKTDWVTAETAPLAICRALLLAVLHPED